MLNIQLVFMYLKSSQFSGKGNCSVICFDYRFKILVYYLVFNLDFSFLN